MFQRQTQESNVANTRERVRKLHIKSIFRHRGSLQSATTAESALFSTSRNTILRDVSATTGDELAIAAAAAALSETGAVAFFLTSTAVPMMV